MPDRRRHRGPHPEDLRWFAADVWPALRRATRDLNWLLSRGYVRGSALKLVGDRFALAARQRLAVARCSAADAAVLRRRQHQIPGVALVDRPLWLDGYNVLTTVEAALAGGVLLIGSDGAMRDMASMHGSYRKVSETGPALEMLGTGLAARGIGEAVWLLDRPVSNSGRLKQVMEQLALDRRWPWKVELVSDPDAVLMGTENIVATADSGILDQCVAWFNLARETVEQFVPQACVVDLAPTTDAAQ